MIPEEMEIISLFCWDNFFRNHISAFTSVKVGLHATLFKEFSEANKIVGPDG